MPSAYINKMDNETKKIELLAPAGDLEKLKTAIVYGADAVYFGGGEFSLRAATGGFTYEEMEEGLEFAHARGKKCYLTINIYAHNEDIEPLKAYLETIKKMDIDGILVSDPGVMGLIKEYIPNTEIHLSTQANLTNYAAANFWRSLGIKRLVLARELSLSEIKELRKNLPQDTELESFVHGSMCISYSGRCLLSSFMTGRDSNRGLCAHPCRYKYVLQEEKRPGEYYPIEEDDRGTYIMNSKDLCMIHHIPELIQAGIASAKIEGRMKSAYYVATVVSAYRQAIDDYYKDPGNWSLRPELFEELCKASHREFTTGFYFENPQEEGQNYETSAYTKEYTFLGVIKEYDKEKSLALCQQRNKIQTGDQVEIFGPGGNCFTQTIKKMWDYESQEEIVAAPHPKQLILLSVDQTVEPDYMIRRKDS